MKLVLHRRVRSDVDEIMDYYEQTEHPELAQDFYRELRGFMLDAARRPNRYHFSKLISGEPTSNTSLITSSIESWAVACAFSSSGIIAAVPTTVWSASNRRRSSHSGWTMPACDHVFCPVTGFRLRLI